MTYDVFGGTLNLTKPNSGMSCGSRLPKQGMHWEVNSIKQRLGRLRKNWIDSIRQDLIEIGMPVGGGTQHKGHMPIAHCGPIYLKTG